MSRKKTSPPTESNPWWNISDEYQLSPNVTLKKGDPCLLKGQQGSFVFVKHVINTKVDPPSEWVDVWGGVAGHSQHRSVKPEMLKPVPTKRIKKR